MTWKLWYKFSTNNDPDTRSDEEMEVRHEVFADVRAAQFAFLELLTNKFVDEAVVISHGGHAYGDAVLLSYSNNWETDWVSIPDWVE